MGCAYLTIGVCACQFTKARQPRDFSARLPKISPVKIEMGFYFTVMRPCGSAYCSPIVPSSTVLV